MLWSGLAHFVRLQVSRGFEYYKPLVAIVGAVWEENNKMICKDVWQIRITMLGWDRFYNLSCVENNKMYAKTLDKLQLRYCGEMAYCPSYLRRKQKIISKDILTIRIMTLWGDFISPFFFFRFLPQLHKNWRLRNVVNGAFEWFYTRFSMPL